MPGSSLANGLVFGDGAKDTHTTTTVTQLILSKLVIARKPGRAVSQEDEGGLSKDSCFSLGNELRLGLCCQFRPPPPLPSPPPLSLWPAGSLVISESLPQIVPMTVMLGALQERWQALQTRLDAVEVAVDLFCRFANVHCSLEALEHVLQQKV